jgi:serine/threonine-protein kinase
MSEFIGGKYELLDTIGEGGMATVWRGTMHGAAGFTRRVAVKKIKQQFDASNQYIRMFVEEARVGSELAHPNIVQVVDFCTDESGAYYLIMEWVDGLDLAAFVNSFSKHKEKAPWQLIVAIGIGVLRGLSAAHERHRDDGTPAPVIHRDISPHNILLAGNGVAKLSDFGLARARDRGENLTGPGVVKGKLGYWAPEVAGGGQASESSDIFAMGVVLWESLAAERLFDGDTHIDVYRKVLACDVKPLSSRRDDLPGRLVSAVYRALDATPEARFHTARLMAQELAGVLAASEQKDSHKALRDEILRARHRLGGSFLPRNTPPHGIPIEFTEEVETAKLQEPSPDDSIDIQFSEIAKIDDE